MQPSDNALLLSIMKNEGPYLLEWVAHHRAVGFGRIMVFTNDCDDLTDRILDRLDAKGWLRHSPNPRSIMHKRASIQVAALRYATLFNYYRDAEWICFLDADEFLDITPGAHRLPDMFDAMDPFDVISFTVLGHNSDGQREIGDGSVQGRFTRTIAPRDVLNDPAKKRRGAVKSMMRNPMPGAMFRNHRPKIDGFSQMGKRWSDGSGRDFSPAFTDVKVNEIEVAGTMEIAHVNHYSIRSAESYLVKVDRGDIIYENHLNLDAEKIQGALAYWKKRNVGLDNPQHVPPKPEGYSEILAELQGDALLAEMHEESLARHRAKAQRVLETEGGQILAKEMGYL
ncbi:glycosyltransferase family 2 protein [Pseudoruegeria sp. SHC-113]|uniref:glycosyltransferase family 2 protein n=1 Tax=Pseudoruegeria sp. SHC-113 TaxID=2855439 RepID=UPI0021BBA64C|nr:glycosyltransferase family 2 protein [Pseudoruegeria sp. SHC-113]MCT8160404.1 glycosyltransferase family 2 protein [Pseudoruegeria sp. SHC-113]